MRLQLKILQRLRFLCCFLFLVESRAFVPKLIHLQSMLLKPIPSLVKSIFATASTASVSLVTHSLSGATTEIRSNQGSSISIEAGEPFSYQFFTYRYSAQSFRVTGLLEGLSLATSSGYGSISGTTTQTGTFPIQITGFRYPNFSGSSTPTFNLNLQIDPKTNDTVYSFFAPEKINEYGDSWFSSAWFGIFYNSGNSNWIYHRTLGWVYIHPVQEDELWVFDPELEAWLYTSELLHPYFYNHSTGSWLYQKQVSSNHRFWDFSLQADVL